MKLTRLIVLALLCPGCVGLQPSDSSFQIDELVGEYRVYKAEATPVSSSGWSFGKRYERTLVLHPDSSYDEINLSFAAFDYIDEFGKWEIVGKRITLNPLGSLDYVDGQYERISDLESKPLRYLEILSQKELKIVDEGFLKNEQMIRQVVTKGD